jgi:glycerol uptake facilitator-like aquaporin
VTLARCATNTFSGYGPTDAFGFIVAQLLGAATATQLGCIQRRITMRRSPVLWRRATSPVGRKARGQAWLTPC